MSLKIGDRLILIKHPHNTDWGTGTALVVYQSIMAEGEDGWAIRNTITREGHALYSRWDKSNGLLWLEGIHYKKRNKKSPHPEWF